MFRHRDAIFRELLQQRCTSQLADVNGRLAYTSLVPEDGTYLSKHIGVHICLFYRKLLLLDSIAYSMEQSSSLEANRFAASQEIPRI
jgi:hypothetical protein